MKAGAHPATAADAGPARAADCAAAVPALGPSVVEPAPLTGLAVPPESPARFPAGTFEALVEQHRAFVTRLAYRLLGWRDEAEDAAQDVFLAALRGWPKYRGESKVSTWLTTITVHTCRTWRRKRLLRWRVLAAEAARLLGGRAPADDRVPRDSSKTGASPEQAALDRETFARVRAALRGLPAREREVAVLRYLEQLSVDEIGEILGLKRNAVEVRLYRARRHLREFLGDLQEG